MRKTKFFRDEDGELKVKVSLRGYPLLRQPLLNKGTGFSQGERDEFGLNGLLPSQYNSIELQSRRVHESVVARDEPLEKYLELANLQDRNEILFYHLLCEHLQEYMPIVYTPTVGKATLEFSHVFKRGRGVWITPDHRGRIAEILKSVARFRNVRLIVATDNESILGIGDQGAGGMAISVGKLALYIAGAGIHPTHTLPVSLDVGTNNKRLLEDELYLGWRHKRLKGPEYGGLIEEFVQAVKSCFPEALLQWEDFRKDNALRILDRYHDQILSFNDDIQGTGAVALAGVLSAMRIIDEHIEQQRIVVLGAGAAGLGIARQLHAGMRHHGVADEELHQRIAVLDSHGLLAEDRQIEQAYKHELAWSSDLTRSIGLEDPSQRQLADVVHAFKPTVLIGVSGQGGNFTETIVRDMASHVKRPVIMPFSNPNTRSEATPEDLVNWTEGRCLIATGSPFEDVHYGGKVLCIGQGNNVFIFPGLGLGALQSGARAVTPGMISAAATALAHTVTAEELNQGQLYPRVSRLREVTREVACSVMLKAAEDGVADDIGSDEAFARLDKAMWQPEYPEFVPI